MTKHMQSPWMVTHRQIARMKKIKKRGSIVVLAMMTLTYVCSVFQPQARAENLPQFPEIDPCEITITACKPETLEKWRRQDIQEKIEHAAADVYMDIDAAVRIANCESGFNQYASNTESSAKGVYQFLDSTWEYIGAVGHPYDVDESIKQFMIWYPIHPEWWACK